MLSILPWVLIYCVVTALSIALLGDRSLISGNLLSINSVLKLIFHWKFILSMLFAITSRAAFIMVNNALLRTPHLAKSSTTITAFVLASAYIFIIVMNAIMLNEKLTMEQHFGAALILAGVLVICR